MKSIIKRNSFLFILFLIAGIFTFISALFQVNQYKNGIEFQKKYMYQMVGAYESNINVVQIAGAVLKGDVDINLIEKGKIAIEKYGYNEDYETIYDKQLNVFIGGVVIFHIIIYFFTIVSFISLKYYMKKLENKKLGNITENIIRFHNGEYAVDLDITLKGVEGKLNGYLESLGKRILLNESRFEKEKEDTKALVTDISHQLKTPIASLKMCISLLNEENLDEIERKEFMERSIEQLNHLESLTSALVNISRMETGMIKILREDKRIIDTIISAINSVYIMAEEKNILIDFDSCQESNIENLVLPHDEKWTREAISNVLENSIKYSEKGTKITIKITKLVSFLRIDIEDEGIGVDKGEYTNIFKRFYRGKSEIAKNVEGSGVGLYLTRKILEEQGGNITVTSKKGSEAKGSIFTIQLSLM